MRKHIFGTHSVAWALVAVMTGVMALPVFASCCCLPTDESMAHAAEVSSATGCCGDESVPTPREVASACCAIMGGDSTNPPAPVTTHTHGKVELKRVALTILSIDDVVSVDATSRVYSLRLSSVPPSPEPIYLLTAALVI